MPSRRTAIIAALLLILAGLALAAYVVLQHRQQLIATAESVTEIASIGGPFTLTDHTGRRVTDADFAGKYRLVFFGFASCPDVCPTTLNRIALTMEALGDRAAEVQPLFITVDPERDTPEVLADYVSLFDANIVGLTGSPAEIEAVAKSYRVYFRKVPIEGDPDNYTMDHSAILYLMGPDGAYVTLLNHDDPPEILAEEIVEHIDEGA